MPTIEHPSSQPEGNALPKRSLSPWLLTLLACPRHQVPLREGDRGLQCEKGCKFPIVDGVPVLVVEEASETIGVAEASLRLASEPSSDGGLYLGSLAIPMQAQQGVRELIARGETDIDPVVSYLVAATNGLAFRRHVGKLNEYPIPELPLPPADGEVLLDVGCNWGRWLIAAARNGYRAIGVDPSLGAVMAGRRVASSLGVEVEFVVGDARFLPFSPSVVGVVYSYSVLQHLSREDTALAVAEAGRVLHSGGRAHIQMPSKLGIRCLYHQARRRFREPTSFEVRYWTLPALRRLFVAKVGKTRFAVDCFFGIGLQWSDRRFMGPLMKIVIALSELLRRTARYFPPLVWCADSILVISSHKRPRGA